MIYRVVERADGLYQAQYRILLFWWADSCHRASGDLAEQIDFAAYLSTPPRQVRRVKRVVWPIKSRQPASSPEEAK